MIKVLTVSDDWHHFEKPIMEYQKRLMKTCDLVTLKPSKARIAKQIIDEETEKIITVLEKYRGFVILCDEFGKKLTSPALSQFLATLQGEHGNVLFIIGGSYGVNREKIAPYIDHSLGLSDFTLPHGLAFLTLIEQIYRAHEIQKGSGYHH